MAVVYRFTFDRFDRDDLYQEVFLSAYKHIRRFRGKCAFSTWLHRIALNRCIDWERKRKFESVPLEEPSVTEEGDTRQKLQAIQQALTTLPRGPRVCFHLYYLEGMTIDEVAEILGCRPGSVKSQLNRARKKIRLHHEVRPWIQSTI